MTDRLGQLETAALLTLMVLARKVSNPELEEIVGFRLNGKPRLHLNELKLVESEQVGRRYVHTLTEDGWAWCADELKALTPPSRHGSLSGALYVLLSGLGGYIQREDLSLKDLFTELTLAEIESGITAAYRKLASSPREWVNLKDLRPKLGKVPRKQVDTALKDMYNASQLHLAPRSDRKALTDADHDAAIRFGGQDYHRLMIEAS